MEIKEECMLVDEELYKTFSKELNQYLIVYSGCFKRSLIHMEKQTVCELLKNGIENVTEEKLNDNKIYLSYINGFRHGLRFVNDFVLNHKKEK